MSLFLTDFERQAFHKFRKEHLVGEDLFWALLNRVSDRTSVPGLSVRNGTSHWWSSAAEFLSDAAMVHALKPTPAGAAWVRDGTLSLVRRPEEDWVGPEFRTHSAGPAMGHLETAHLSWAVAVALDLAEEVFSPQEAEEIRSILRERGIPMCRRWLDSNTRLANWRCVLGAGVAVAAAVLDIGEEIDRAVDDYNLNIQSFQPDGSYGESLQYGNYAAYNLMLTREALLRRNPALEAKLPLAPWGKLPRWQAASLFYRKPLFGGVNFPQARSANFNDSGAIFRPSGDLLLHIAARGGEEFAKEAGLARWLFDTLYAPNLDQGPHDAATFGFVNDFGFLAIPLLPKAATGKGPAESGLPEVAAFSCGDVIARDEWGGKTVLATHGGGDPLCGPGHLHGDLNSFILVHNRERFLVDPGHSCYRNLIHGLEITSRTHNTCTFALEGEGARDPGLQEDRGSETILEQSCKAKRYLDPETRKAGAPFNRGGRRLITARMEDVTVIGSEAGALYGNPVLEFSRFWILCGSRALFVVDRIVSETPLKTRWHWLLNNRDGHLNLKIVRPDRLVARRGSAGMKFFHLAGGTLAGPAYAHVHDAYSPDPNQNGEGKSGSGTLLTWSENQPATTRTAVHAIALDGYGTIAGWHLKEVDGLPVLESPGATERWRLDSHPDLQYIRLSETVSGRQWSVENEISGGRIQKTVLEGYSR